MHIQHFGWKFIQPNKLNHFLESQLSKRMRYTITRSMCVLSLEILKTFLHFQNFRDHPKDFRHTDVFVIYHLYYFMTVQFKHHRGSPHSQCNLQSLFHSCSFSHCHVANEIQVVQLKRGGELGF